MLNCRQIQLSFVDPLNFYDAVKPKSACRVFQSGWVTVSVSKNPTQEKSVMKTAQKYFTGDLSCKQLHFFLQ